MNKIGVKKLSFNLVFLIAIFLIDRLTKNYILEIAEKENSVDIYITSYLNLYFFLFPFLVILIT